MDVFRTIVVPAAKVVAAREVAGDDRMFLTGLSLNGNPPPSHYIASGFIPTEMLEDLESSGLGLNITDLPPMEVITTLNLKMVTG